MDSLEKLNLSEIRKIDPNKLNFIKSKKLSEITVGPFASSLTQQNLESFIVSSPKIKIVHSTRWQKEFREEMIRLFPNLIIDNIF